MKNESLGIEDHIIIYTVVLVVDHRHRYRVIDNFLNTFSEKRCKLLKKISFRSIFFNVIFTR